MTTTHRHLAIAATGLRKSYGDKTVLDGIDIHVPGGTIFSLLGPNGAGKTTVVNILSTLISADDGQARIAGHDIATEAQAVRAAIGVTGQFSAVDGLITGEENMLLMADLHHLPRAEGRRVTAALLLALFTAGGLVYGGVFRRAANDRRAGWMLGLAYGFLMWIAAPIVVLPLLRSDAMAAGTAADGFLVAFLLWGLTVGIAFPFVHRPLHAGLDGRSKRFGPDVVTLRRKLLRRPTAG